MKKPKNLTEFGRKVKKALVDAEMTQTELAARIGVSRQYVSMVLKGEYDSPALEMKIRKFLGEWLDGN